MTILLFGCESTDYTGYTRLDKSVHFKMLAVGDESKKISTGSYITMEVKASSLDGKWLARKKLQRVEFEKALIPRNLKPVFRDAMEGDSLAVIGRVDELEATTWFAPVAMGEDSNVLMLSIVIREVLSAEEVLQLRAKERAESDGELMQLRSLKNALDSLQFSKDDAFEGIYYKQQVEGNGPRPTTGREATVHYKTYLSNGALVDDTYQGEPLVYVVGKPDQVLPGFSIALSRMKKGEKALFVIPSELAYGARGSSSGIVPPHAALIYEAELVNVR